MITAISVAGLHAIATSSDAVSAPSSATQPRCAGALRVTSVDPLPLNQSEVQGTSGIIDDSAQEDTASVVDLSKCYRLGQMKFIYTY